MNKYQTVIKLLENKMEIPEITKDMIDHYKVRTERHISLVKKYAQKIADIFPELSDVVKQTEDHDQSKYGNVEYEPYVFITWKYKCADDGVDFCVPEIMQNKMHDATFHHIKTNKHHPEYHDPNVTSDSLNSRDRDKPAEKSVDATNMDDISIAEMCADWCAMSEERGNTPQSWADKNVNIRWMFTPDQKELIYKILDSVWK